MQRTATSNQSNSNQEQRNQQREPTGTDSDLLDWVQLEEWQKIKEVLQDHVCGI